MDNTSFKRQHLSPSTCGKFQPWVAFSRKENIPSQFMIDLVKPTTPDPPVPGSAGEINQDIEYDTGSAKEAN